LPITRLALDSLGDNGLAAHDPFQTFNPDFRMAAYP
jgi:hypothetical protein